LWFVVHCVAGGLVGGVAEKHGSEIQEKTFRLGGTDRVRDVCI
jgi:hypothetical protein